MNTKLKGWRINPRASGGSEWTRKIGGKKWSLFKDHFGELRIMEEGTGKWAGSIKLKKDESLESGLSRLTKELK